jgi:hypothetical protein
MGKALKAFIVLNFLLSIAVVALGVKVFLDREVIKARTLLMEEYAAKTATNLEWGGQVDWETSDLRKTNPFAIPQPLKPEELPALESSLSDLARFATQRQAQLSQNYADLVATRQELAETRDTLATRTRELADARTQIASLESTLAKTQNDLSEANRTIDTLRMEKESLERQVDGLNKDVQERNDRIASLEVDLEKAISERDRAIARVQTLEGQLAGDKPSSRIWNGRAAQILAVNDKWNYVIIDKGSKDEMEMFLEAFVHRGDTYVGKLRVTRIEEAVSVAEIQTDTLVDGTFLQPGDTIFF